MKTPLILITGLLAVALGFFASQWWRSQATSSPQAAPGFTLTDLNGQSHQLADYRGKLLMLNFWATWCTPCLKEMPLLNSSYQQHREAGLVILGPAIDDSAQVAGFVDELDIDYPVSAGGTELFELMDALGDTLGALPFTVLINRQGHIVARHWGELSPELLQNWIKKHL